jgi:hypothetical protein
MSQAETWNDPTAITLGPGRIAAVGPARPLFIDRILAWRREHDIPNDPQVIGVEATELDNIVSAAVIDRTAAPPMP